MHKHKTSCEAARPRTTPTAHFLKWPGNFKFHSIKVSADGKSWPETELTMLQAQAVARAVQSYEQEQMKRVRFCVERSAL